MTTPPTPAEVAEARAWFEKRQTRYGTGPEYWIADAGDGQRHAAVLVRAALAAPAEQPREDDGPSGFVLAEEGPRSWYVHNRVFPTYAEAYRASRENGVRWDTDRECEVPAATIVPVGAARSVSPSAVPAVSDTSPSAGGAGRDLTAQDVRDAVERGAGHGAKIGPQVIADALNEIARPADTGTQATEQTTEYRVYVESPSGNVFDDHFPDVWAARAQMKEWHDRGWVGARVEKRFVRTSRSVSPWSPVAVHDEKEQR